MVVDVVRRRRLWAIAWRVLIGALVLGAATVFVVAFVAARVLDLARLAENEHLQALASPPAAEGGTDSLSEIQTFFLPHFRFEIRLPEPFPQGFRLRGYEISSFRSMRAGAFRGYIGSTLVTFYMFDRRDLQQFPEAAKALLDDGRARSFPAGDFVFTAAVKRAVVICGIGRLEAPALESVVDAWVKLY